MEKSGPSVVRQLRFVVGSWKEDPRTDVELLTRFVQTGDEPAFTALVGRHSELVWGVCLRVLRNRADAEDALQATFLRLARDAKRIIKREAFGGWLFRVARDCAIDLQRSNARQRRIEERLAEVGGANAADVPNDLRVLLDDELALLPRSERAVLVLCCLEGRTYADAALELGCSTAAVHRRLVRAQTRLRRKFARHGRAALGLLAGVFAGTVLPAASAAPPVVLAGVVETALAARSAGPGAAAGAAGAGGLVRAGIALTVAAAGLAGGLFALVTNRPAPVAPLSPVAEIEQPTGAPQPTTALTGVVRGPDGEPVAGASVAVLARRPFAPGARGLRDELIATATADEQGRFTVSVPDDFETWFAGRVVTVQASGPNHAPATATVRLRPSPSSVGLGLKSSMPLRGRLIDEAGRPAAGVRLELVRVGDSVAEPMVGRPGALLPGWPQPVTSGADGAFALPTVGGAANVWVRVNDQRFALDTFRVDGSAGAGRYPLAPARPLVVEVRAADTGEPLAGAGVTIITERVSAHPHFCAAEHGALGPYSLPSDIDALTDARGLVRVNLAPGDRAEVLVHPPAGAAPYLGLRAQHTVASTGAEERVAVQLTRGRWVTGRVCDQTNRPLTGAAVHWARATGAQPEWKDETLSGRDALTRTGPDGVFRLAMPPGVCEVRAYGPTADYETAPGKLPGTANGTIYAHQHATLDVPAAGDVPSLGLALRSAPTARGAIEHPADRGSTFFVCAGRVSAVRAYSVVPLPVSDGAFTVPGCRTGHTARAYLLDPVAKLGAVADVAPGATAPVVKLLPCGALRVRVREADGRPAANRNINLALLADRDRPTVSASEPVFDPQPVEWFDAINYPTRPKTNADGVAELPALVPGARYTLAISNGSKRFTVGTFLIEPGKTVARSEVTLPARPEGGVP